MECYVCHQKPAHGVTLIRQNDTDKPRIWACRAHDRRGLDQDTDKLVRILEGRTPAPDEEEKP